MRFLQSIQEEYFTRIGSYEIFKNPSQKEVSVLYGLEMGIRSLVDFDNKICFMFSGDLLHQSAIKQIIKEYDGSGLFYCGEVYNTFFKDVATMIINFTHGGFKVVDHKAMWVNKWSGDINWFLNYLKHLPDFKNHKIEDNA